MRLAVRGASGAVLLVLLGGALYLGRTWFAVLVTVLVAIGLYEYHGLWRARGTPPSLPVLVPLAGFWLFRYAYPQIPTASLGLLLAVTAGLTLGLARTPYQHPLVRWASGVGGAIWLGYLPGSLLLLYGAAGSRDRALALVLLTVAVAVLGDSAAYLVGSRLGRHPFFPRISPKKTWEGALSGWLLATVVVGALLPLVLPRLDQLVAFAVAAAAAAAAVVGDLAESQLKREMGAKDSGSIIPGHGGVLDRVDSLIFVGAVVYSLLGAAHAF